jgi:hypothetical protein
MLGIAAIWLVMYFLLGLALGGTWIGAMRSALVIVGTLCFFVGWVVGGTWIDGMRSALVIVGTFGAIALAFYLMVRILEWLGVMEKNPRRWHEPSKW